MTDPAPSQSDDALVEELTRIIQRGEHAPFGETARAILPIIHAREAAAKADAERLASAKEQAEMLAEALHEFIDCARYDPHMGGGSTFMGWRQSDLKRAEERARQALATYREKQNG
jgi:hypothetical protein